MNKNNIFYILTIERKKPKWKRTKKYLINFMISNINNLNIFLIRLFIQKESKGPLKA